MLYIEIYYVDGWKYCPPHPHSHVWSSHPYWLAHDCGQYPFRTDY